MFNCVTDVTEFELGLLRACWFIPILLCYSSSQPVLGDLAELLTLGPFLPLWCLIHRHGGIEYLHLPQTRLFQRILFSSLFVLLIPRVLLCCRATDIVTMSVDAFPLAVLNTNFAFLQALFLFLSTSLQFYLAFGIVGAFCSCQ